MPTANPYRAPSVNCGDPECSDCNLVICPDCDEYTADCSCDDRDACEDCGCYDCECPSPHIKSYGFKPAPVFYGRPNGKNKPLYYGIELEIETGKSSMSNEDIAEYVCEFHVPGTRDGFFYCKDDSSIDEGFEIVSHPATLEHWRRIQPQIAGLFSDLQSFKALSYKTTSCGMHIHASRSGLSHLDQLKLMCFFQNGAQFMFAVSRRKRFQFDQWSAIDHEGRRSYVQKVKTRYGPRGAFNVNPRNTVEFRLFRGTLHAGAFYRNLELTNALVAYVRRSPLNEMVPALFVGWLLTPEAQKVVGKKESALLHVWLLGIEQRLLEDSCAFA